MATKLPLIITLMSLIAAGVLGVNAYLGGRQILRQEIENKFTTALQARAKSIELVLSAIDADMKTQANNPTIGSAINSFRLAWTALGDDPFGELQRNYIENNPNPQGQRHLLDQSEAANQYDNVHRKYHSYFRDLVGLHGYHDAFLIDAEGNVIYSVFKEGDFATNLATGAWKDTDLAAAHWAAMEAASGETALFDFSSYPPSNDAPASFIATPIMDRNGNPLGTLAYQLPADLLSDIAGASEGLGKTGSAFIVGADRRLRSDMRGSNAPSTLDHVEISDDLMDVFDGDPSEFLTEELSDGTFVEALSQVIRFKGVQWALIMRQNRDEAFAPLNDQRNLLIIQFGVLAVLITIIGVAIGRSMARPLSVVGQSIKGVADGDLDSRIPLTERREDIGELARNLENLRQKLAVARDQHTAQQKQAEDQRIVVEHLTSAISKLADGDLTNVISTQFTQDYETLRNGFNTAVAKLNETISDLVGAAKEIDSNAHGVENASNDLSQRAIEQAANLEETAAAITELSASVKSTADSASEADDVMTRAKSDATKSHEVVSRAMVAMSEISASSQKITQVTSVIEDLAFQTNLLALNAGVEAARAGEAGRGFAVVASEVRALAQRSSDAAKEINGLIKESADNVAGGVDLVQRAGKSFETLIGEFDKVSESVSSIAAAAREQSVGLAEINTAVDQLDGVTQKNAAAASQVHGTGKMMVNEADKLMRISQSFRCDGNIGQHSTKSRSSSAHAPVAAKVAVNAPVHDAPASSDDWAEF